ncbi:hypothetical protein RSAG8_10727, partial [Rhizoctonia solani AG-8 WAC10335]
MFHTTRVSHLGTISILEPREHKLLIDGYHLLCYFQSAISTYSFERRRALYPWSRVS